MEDTLDPRISLYLVAGFDLAVTRQATLSVGYSGQLANSVQDHAVKGRFGCASFR
jgi:hypothetical protein